MPKRRLPKRRRYDNDLTDEQWTLIGPSIPEARAEGRRHSLLPAGWHGVATAAAGFAAVADRLLLPVSLAGGKCSRLAAHPPRAGARQRNRCGRDASPSAAVLDSLRRQLVSVSSTRTEPLGCPPV